MLHKKDINLSCSKIFNYLNPTAACQTKAKSKKNTGITGATSMIGLKIAYASGNLANSKVPSIFFWPLCKEKFCVSIVIKWTKVKNHDHLP